MHSARASGFRSSAPRSLQRPGSYRVPCRSSPLSSRILPGYYLPVGGNVLRIRAVLHPPAYARLYPSIYPERWVRRCSEAAEPGPSRESRADDHHERISDIHLKTARLADRPALPAPPADPGHQDEPVDTRVRDPPSIPLV